MTKNEKERKAFFAIPLLYNAGSGLSIKLLSALKLLSAIKTGICIGRAVMALLFFIPKFTSKTLLLWYQITSSSAYRLI